MEPPSVKEIEGHADGTAMAAMMRAHRTSIRDSTVTKHNPAGPHDSKNWVAMDVLERKIDEMGSRIDRDGMRVRYGYVALVNEPVLVFREHGHLTRLGRD